MHSQIGIDSLSTKKKAIGAIAQLVEQRTENPCVPGSIPGGTTPPFIRAVLFESALFCSDHIQLFTKTAPVNPHLKISGMTVPFPLGIKLQSGIRPSLTNG